MSTAAQRAKTLLKSARDAIAAKEFDKALRDAQDVLQHDAANYNAMIFAGLALDKLKCVNESAAMYRRAIDAQPTQILAWQVAIP
jgi:superkiller protein 3